MIEKKDLYKMARHIFRHSHGISDTKIMHPMREWVIGLGGSFATIIIGAVVSINTFVSFNQEQIYHPDVTEVAIPYNASLVEAAISKYQAKIDTYQTISNQSLATQLPPIISITTTPTEQTVNTDTVVTPVAN